MSRQTSLPNSLNCDILDIGLRASVITATLWASVTLVAGQTKSMGQSEPDITLMSLVLHGEIVTHIVILFLSDTLIQVNILQLWRSDIVLLGAVLALTTLSLRDFSHTGTCSDKEHGSNRTRHDSDVSRSLWRDSNTHRNTILLRHAGPGELSPASMISYRHARSRSRSYNSVSSRRHSRSPSRSRGKKKKSFKKKKKHSNHFRTNVIRVRRNTRGRGVLIHLLLLCLLQFLHTLLLFFWEDQPRSSLELIGGLLLRLMTFLIPLLGLRVRRHTGIISVFLRIMMTNFIRSLRIIRT